MKGGEKTFHHCRNFPYNFSTLPRVLTRPCKCARTDKGGEREPLSLASLRMTHRAAEKPSIHPSGHLLSHSPIPSQPAIFSPARGKIAQLAEAITERRGAAAGNPFSLSSPPRSTFLGRRSSHSLPLSPSPASAGAVPEMDGTMRRVLCTCAPVGCSTFDDSSSTPYLSPIASPSSNAISSKRLTKYICNQLVTRTK